MLSHPTLFYALYSSPPPFNSLPCCFHFFSFLTSLQWKNIHNRSQNILFSWHSPQAVLLLFDLRQRKAQTVHLTTSKLPLVHQLNCVCMYIHHAIKLNEIFVRIFYSKAYIKEHVVMKIFKEQYTVSSSYSAHTVLIQCSYSALCHVIIQFQLS